MLVKVIPLILLAVIAVLQFQTLNSIITERTALLNTNMNQTLSTTGDIAVLDSVSALNASAIESIERMTTDTAQSVANFLYGRDSDILYVATLPQNDDFYKNFINSKTGKIIDTSDTEWIVTTDDSGVDVWTLKSTKETKEIVTSTNSENNDRDGFNYREPDTIKYIDVPLYDEITYINLEGLELYKAVSNKSTKINYPLSQQKSNISTISTLGTYENTYVKSESYWPDLLKLKPGEIYVSDVIGAYVGSNYIGMYTESVVNQAAVDRGYSIEYNMESQAYAGMENPYGQRFEGIIRWATPVVDNNDQITGYVTLALNHDHIMEFVDHITPMNDRYTELPNAYDGNYAFIWDYNCRSIAHPRHHSIVGYDPDTGLPETPWLETSIYKAWIEAGGPEVIHWEEFVESENVKLFDNQSRQKVPALELTQAGLVGLDGRYLNNAPQCTGWMDLTKDGGSGSFYILWSGLYKLTTAASIPYYTGRYSEEQSGTKRGFGFVAIGAGLDDFTRPAMETELKLTSIIKQANDELTASTDETRRLMESNLNDTTTQLVITTIIIILIMIVIAIWLSSSLTGNLTRLNKGIARFRAGERQFRFNSVANDEFGELAEAFDDMATSVVDSVKNIMSIVDKNQNIIYINEHGLAYNGYKLEEIVGKPYSEFSIYPSNTKYCPITALENHSETEIFYHESTHSYLKGTANYLYDKSGAKTGYIIESADMTEMVNEKLQIEAERTLLSQIFENSPDLIWNRDVYGHYITVNPRFASINGLKTDDFIGKTATNILPQGTAEIFDEFDKKAIESLIPIFTEEKITFADGHNEILDSVRTPILDKITGKTVSVLGFARNITSRVLIEEELRFTQTNLEKAVLEANRANSHKGEFLARMSHEIRTPMNAIICITDIIQRKLATLSDKIVEINDIETDLGHIEVSSKHLLNLLNDILDITKIESGKIDILEEPVELNKTIDTVTQIIRPRCDAKNIKFTVEMDIFDVKTFMFDSLRLRQVIINLLGNAVKFTPEVGSISFKIQQVDRNIEESKTLVRFTVTDSGIGIAEDKLEAVFNSFEQGGSGISQKYGGTGLGLAISRKIVQLLDGDIKVKSILGCGSEFSFEIWLKEAYEEITETTRTLSDAYGKFVGRRVLIVDDVEINRVILESLLDCTGLEFDSAPDGEKAVEKFQNSKEFYYDAILMDIQMPILDGYQATSIIRSMARSDSKTVPIIALTANAFKDDIEKAVLHGMNSHIAKPIEETKLVEALFKYIKIDK
jgi:PAS domain S-box-containing protein